MPPGETWQDALPVDPCPVPITRAALALGRCSKDSANVQGLPAFPPQFLCPPAEQHLAKCSVELASLLGMAPFYHITLLPDPPVLRVGYGQD